MDQSPHLSDIAQKILPLVDAALALSRDEELMKVLRLYAEVPRPAMEQQPFTTAPRNRCRRRRNPNPCFNCASNKQACKYIRDNPLICANCDENNLRCVMRERKRPRPTLDLSVVQAPAMSSRLSSMSQPTGGGPSPSIPSSATSQLPMYEAEMAMVSSAPAVTFSQSSQYSPSFALGVQPSNPTVTGSNNEQFISQGLADNFPNDHGHDAPYLGMHNNPDYFPQLDCRNVDPGVGSARTRY